MRAAPPRGKAWERIYFVLAAFAVLGAAQAYCSTGFDEDFFVGVATAAAFALGGGFARHWRKVAEFKRGYPGWSEFDFVRRRRK